MYSEPLDLFDTNQGPEDRIYKCLLYKMQFLRSSAQSQKYGGVPLFVAILSNAHFLLTLSIDAEIVCMIVYRVLFHGSK